MDAELWGEGMKAERPMGWFRADSASEIAGFFLAFNAGFSAIDGTDASGASRLSWLFPEIAPDGFTQFHVANPNPESAIIRFELVNGDGVVRATASRTIAARGAVLERKS